MKVTPCGIVLGVVVSMRNGLHERLAFATPLTSFTVGLFHVKQNVSELMKKYPHRSRCVNFKYKSHFEVDSRAEIKL